MPGSFVGAIVFAVLAVVALIVAVVASRAAKHDRPRYGSNPAPMVRTVARWATVGLVVLTGILVFSSSATTVSTKNVGIVTSYGKPVDSLSNGFHMIAPWDKVTEMPATIQTDNHKGGSSGGDGECTTVKLANQSEACVDNSIRWRIKQNAADALFRDYKDFTNVKDSLVTRELNAAIVAEFSKYDPLAALAQNAANPQANSLQQFDTNVANTLRKQVGSQIDVLNVIISYVNYDKNTQDKINQFQAAVANTRIAEQNQKTAAAEAQANKELSGSVSNNPNVLVSKCLDLLAQMINKGMTVPAGFTCWPGGSNTAVLASANK